MGNVKMGHTQAILCPIKSACFVSNSLSLNKIIYFQPSHVKYEVYGEN